MLHHGFEGRFFTLLALLNVDLAASCHIRTSQASLFVYDCVAPVARMVDNVVTRILRCNLQVTHCRFTFLAVKLARVWVCGNCIRLCMRQYSLCKSLHGREMEPRYTL